MNEDLPNSGVEANGDRQISVNISLQAANILFGMVNDWNESVQRSSILFPERIIIPDIPSRFYKAINDASDGRTTFDISYNEIEHLSGLAYVLSLRKFFPTAMPAAVVAVPVNEAFSDFYEAFVRAGGEDNPILRRKFELVSSADKLEDLERVI